jgi:TonB family protein
MLPTNTMFPMRNSILGLELTQIRGLVVLACVLALARTARPDDLEKRKTFAQQLTKDIARSGLRKIYVPDFTDTSGRQVLLGRFFAGTFSKLFDDTARDFTVISRITVHRYLAKSGWTDHDLSTADVLAKVASDFSPDAILWGSMSLNQDVATIDLIVRDPLGKELFRSQYEEKLTPDLREDFEAGPSGGDFYFVGLDGVTLPKCLHCPIPFYPVGQGSRSVEGDVILSVLVTLEGKPDQIHLIQKLSPVFDLAAIEEVRSWRFEPSKDADGKFVPVRVPVQITFKRHWQVR